MVIILAVDGNWNIGYNGEMLFRISNDLKRFKNITENNIVIMGRKTYESLPEENRPLKNRINIVLTRNKDFKDGSTIVVNTVDALMDVLRFINKDKYKKEFVIGGGEIVELLIDKCDTALITRMDAVYELSDASVRNLSEDPEWEVKRKSKIIFEQGMSYRYIEYERI